MDGKLKAGPQTCSSRTMLAMVPFVRELGQRAVLVLAKKDD